MFRYLLVTILFLTSGSIPAYAIKTPTQCRRQSGAVLSMEQTMVALKRRAGTAQSQLAKRLDGYQRQADAIAGQRESYAKQTGVEPKKAAQKMETYDKREAKVLKAKEKARALGTPRINRLLGQYDQLVEPHCTAEAALDACLGEVHAPYGFCWFLSDC